MLKFKHRIGIIIIVFLGIILISCHHELKFDSEKWKKGGGENITLETRTKMVNDLIESRILINKLESEIAELIGNPEKLHNRKNSYTKYYPVQEKYELDIDPKEMVFLENNYNNQGISETVKLIKVK